MYKKICLYLLLMNSFVYSTFSICNELEIFVESSDTSFDQNEFYDQLDYLADNQESQRATNHNVPTWFKSLYVGILLGLFEVTNYCEQSWDKVKQFFNKK